MRPTPPQQSRTIKRTATRTLCIPRKNSIHSALSRALASVGLSRAPEAAWALSTACTPIRLHHRATAATSACEVRAVMLLDDETTL